MLQALSLDGWVVVGAAVRLLHAVDPEREDDNPTTGPGKQRVGDSTVVLDSRRYGFLKTVHTSIPFVGVSKMFGFGPV